MSTKWFSPILPRFFRELKKKKVGSGGKNRVGRQPETNTFFLGLTYKKCILDKYSLYYQKYCFNLVKWTNFFYSVKKKIVV